MRAPFQILAIPYRRRPEAEFCVFRRADNGQYQFIAGGGEDNETPEAAARREIREEASLEAVKLTRLTSMAYVPAEIISASLRAHWPKDAFVIPEYAFAFECEGEIVLSAEHTGAEWLRYGDAVSRLSWDSNRTALYELKCRLSSE